MIIAIERLYPVMSTEWASKMGAVEEAITGLSSFVKVQGTRLLPLYSPASSPLMVVFFFHLLMDTIRRAQERECVSATPCLSLQGPLLGELLTSFSDKWSLQTRGNRPSPHPFPWPTHPMAALWFRATPRHPILCSAQVKTGGLSFN